MRLFFVAGGIIKLTGISQTGPLRKRAVAVALSIALPVSQLWAQASLVGTSPGVPVVQSERTRSRAWEGAAIGFVVGAAATAIVTRSGGSTAPCDRAANQDALSPGECIGLALAGGVVGGVVGALVGSRIRVSVRRNPVPEPWRPAARPFRGCLLLVQLGALP